MCSHIFFSEIIQKTLTEGIKSGKWGKSSKDVFIQNFDQDIDACFCNWQMFKLRKMGDWKSSKVMICLKKQKIGEASKEQMVRSFPKNPNIFLRLGKEGTVLCANKAADTLLEYWA